MEHSRIILGEKVYKELNPTSKEKYQTPTFLPDPYLLAYPPAAGRQPAVVSSTILSLSSITFFFYLPLYTPTHPLLRIGLVE